MNDQPSAYDLADRARRHCASGRWHRALHDLDRALAREPDQPGWWLARGVALEALRRTGEAAEAYQRAAGLAPADHEPWTRLGAARVRRGEPRLAIEALEHAQSLDPDQHDCYCHRVAAYAQLGDHEQAELMFYLGQQQDSGCPDCYDHLAHVLADRGRLEQAIGCWRRVRDLAPGYPQVGANLGRCFWYLKQFEDARHSYERHLTADPTDADTMVELAALLIETGDLELAEARVEQAIALRPDDAAGHHLRGDLALRRRQPVTADHAYRAALEARPGRPGLRLGLALVARMQGKTDTCLRHLYDELRITGQDAGQVLQLARLLTEFGQHRQTLALLTPAIDGPDDVFRGSPARLAEALRLRATAEDALGQTPRAIADLRRSTRLDPGHLAGWQRLAADYLRAGQTRRAQACLHRALKLAPEDPRLRKLAGQLRWQRWARAAAAPLRRAA